MGWVAIASAAMQGFQAIKGYQQQKQAAKETKRANEAMMQTAEEEAAYVRSDAAAKSKAALRAAQVTRSQQLALYLKSGVTLDGSPMLVLDDTTAQGAENANNIKTSADFQADSLIKRAKANQAPIQRADFFGTAATVLGAGDKANTAGKAAGYWS